MKLLSTLILSLALTGCSIFGRDRVEPIEVITKQEETVRLDLKHPQPISPLEVKWVVITPENAEEVFKKLKEKGTDLVLFGLTDEGYERLSINVAKFRDYIDNQRAIIVEYKEYYEK